METDRSSTDLRSVLTTLARQRWVIAGTAGIALLLGLGWALLADTVYESEARVVLEPSVPAQDPQFTGRVFFQDQELATEIERITSDAVLDRATERLGVPRAAVDDVSATGLPETRIIAITARGDDPEDAADLATAVSEEYLAMRRERATEALDLQREEAQRQIETAREEVTRLNQAIVQQGYDQPELLVERSTALEQLSLAQERLSKSDASIETQSGGGQIIQPATAPGGPTQPNTVQSSLVALLLGFGLGVVIGLVRDTLDESLRSDEDVTAVTGRPVIGHVPTYAAGAEEGDALAILRATDSPEAEAYRDLRANLRFVATDLRTLTVASAIEAEGKSSVAANLAVAAALAGFDVALVDGDLRRPSLHRLFSVRNTVGLAEVLIGEVSVTEATTTLQTPAMSLLTSGHLPPNPSELLGSERLAEIVEELEGQHDLVVVDTPPALAASDALEIASLTDATLLVAHHGATGRQSLGDALQRLERAGATVVGTVVNRVDPQRMVYFYPQRTGK